MINSIEKNEDGSLTVTGTGVSVFQARTIAAGLRLYAETGIKPNSAYTPTNMIRVANRITGHNYRRGQYKAAAAALDEYADKVAKEIMTAAVFMQGKG